MLTAQAINFQLALNFRLCTFKNAPASGGLCPRLPAGALPLDPTRGLPWPNRPWPPDLPPIPPSRSAHDSQVHPVSQGGQCPSVPKIFGTPPTPYCLNYWTSQESSPPLIFFDNFFKNYRELSHNILHTSYPFSYSQIWKFFLLHLQNWQNYAAFYHGNFATFWHYQKSSHINSIHNSANTISVNTLWVTVNAQCLPPAFTLSTSF